MPADSQTLIAYGKKLDDNSKTLAEYNIKEGDFLVIMIAKAKPVAKPEDAKQEEPKSVISPAVTLQASAQPVPVQPVAQPVAQPAPVQQAQPLSPADEEKIANLIAFSGASREKCIRALEAAGGDPNIAFEFISSGIPQQRPAGQGHGGQSHGGAGAQGGLAAFVNSPQFAQIRQRLLQDPNFYQEFMAMLQ